LAYNTKIKNKNIGYFLVNKRVFNTLYKAELYCDKHGFDVNEFIRSENPEVLSEAKEICRNVLPLLYDIKESIRKLHDEQLEQVRKKIDELNESKTKRDLLYDYKNEQVHKALGVIEGISMILNIVNEEIENHKKVIQLKDKWKVVCEMTEVKFDYSKLKGRIREIFDTQSAFAEAMGMSTTSLSAKLNNKIEFSQKEMDKASNLLKIKKEEIPVYFFTPKVQEPEL